VKYLKYNTNSVKETMRLGRRLGTFLEEGDVVALIGELGSGKTWFTKGLALGLGIDPDTVITSPSFAIVNEYQGRQLLYHMDFYRLDNLSDFITSGLEDYIYNNGIVVMEWADRWPEILPEWRIEIRFLIIDDHSRHIAIHGVSERAIGIMESVGQEALKD
jgi:tRNA threonylcarbamoyladenosine biosynthesis protein TsaE